VKPYISKADLSPLPLSQRRKICSCKIPCETGVTLTTFNDGFLLCWNDARKMLYEFISVLDEERRTTWTEKDEEYVIEHYKVNGVYHGINTRIAEALGKSQHQVKSKVARLRKRGRI
jgi:hypothetical protein